MSSHNTYLGLTIILVLFSYYIDYSDESEHPIPTKVNSRF